MSKSKYLIAALLFAVCFSVSAFGQSETKDDKNPYDAKLAEKLGADDYGMRSYVLVVLKTGPNDATVTDKEERQKLFAGHFSNMGRLAKEGKLVFAGPLMEDPPKRGLFIFDVKTIEEAEELVKTDPTVKAGVFVYEITKFYGSAALLKVNEIHKTIQKKEI